MKIPPYVANLKPYQSARSIIKGAGWTFMDANESPYTLLPKAKFKIDLNRYPDPTADNLRKLIARRCKVARQNIIVGNGSDELIDLAIKTFAGLNRQVLSFGPSYGLYKVRAEALGFKYREVPLDKNFEVTSKKVLGCCRKANLLFICRPNNPTGWAMGLREIEKIAKSFQGLIVVDEAYGEFADAYGIPSAIELVSKQTRNILVLRTFSKAYGAAGIRLGYGVANASIVKILLKIKTPYNVNSISQQMGILLLQNRKKMLKMVKTILKQKLWLERECQKLGCQIIPGFANFIFVRLPRNTNVEKVYKNLRIREKIVIRIFPKDLRLKNMIRVTVASPRHNRKLIQALKKFL